MSADKSTPLPYFQQLQQQFAAHIRDPEHNEYAPESEVPIEPRRLVAYQELFFNNLESFFSQIFPVCADLLGEKRWLEIIREYLIKHYAQTPLFHELGQEFLQFLESEFEPHASDPAFLLELAHYEWIELALTISTQREFEGGENICKATLNWFRPYQLSPVAWPLAYDWPVHLLSSTYQPTQKPSEATTLLVYRRLNSGKDDKDNVTKEKVDFIELAPLLYQFLIAIDSAPSAQIAFEEVAKPYQIPSEQLVFFAEQTLQELVSLNILRPMDE